jgi:UDP-N-acetylmuramoyl-tripeptide--D-alanyl-D-alanine ligase
VDALLAMPVGMGGRRIVVAGEMLELGPEGPGLHTASGRGMRERGVDVVIGVRGLAAALASGFGDGAAFVETPEEAGEWLAANVRAGDAVLLKGSRGVRLERALSALAMEKSSA